MTQVDDSVAPAGRAELRKIFDRTYPDVLHYFLRRGYSRDDARDLAQETFVHAIRNWHSYRNEAPPEGWILGIARNVFRGNLRYRRREKRAGAELSLEDWMEQDLPTDGDSAPPQPLRRSLAEERGRLLRKAMTHLTREQRDCLALRIDQELSYREIAEVLQISLEAVKARLFQAKQRLRGSLADHFRFGLD